MSITSVNIDAMLHFWTELEQAYFGVNSFGGHVLEIYAFRLIGREISRGNNEEWDIEEDLLAANALFDLLTKFAAHRSCRIKVEGRALGRWLKTTRFHHRMHVEITPSPKSHDWQVYCSRIKEAVAAVTL